MGKRRRAKGRVEQSGAATSRERILLALFGPLSAVIIALANGIFHVETEKSRTPSPSLPVPYPAERLGASNYPLAADFELYPLVVTAEGRVAFSHTKFVVAMSTLCTTRSNVQSIRDLLSFAEVHHDAVDQLSPTLLRCFRELVDEVGSNQYGSYRQQLIDAAEEVAVDDRYESVVHRVTDPSSSVVYIAHSMGRRKGDPAPADVVQWIRDNAESCKRGDCQRLGPKTGLRRADGTLIVARQELDQSVSYLQYDARNVLVGIRCVNRRSEATDNSGRADIWMQPVQHLLTARNRASSPVLIELLPAGPP